MTSAPNVLVVGGGGYIGSHMVRMLAEQGFNPTTLDNFSEGHRDAVLAGAIIEADIRDAAAIQAALAGRPFDAAMHFAASAYVRESVQAPRKYYVNNVAGTLNLANTLLDLGVKRLVFSSTCATFGAIDEDIAEDAPQRPINPYGATKLMMERLLSDYGDAYGLASISLRYFNAAGASLDGALSERHEPEPHIIPLVLREARRVLDGGDPAHTKLEVFGVDFPTPDGSCVRDYIHVEDLCRAHLLALQRLLADAVTGAEHFNLGSGRGVSVLELIEAARRVTGAPIQSIIGPRRRGDPARLVASSKRAEAVLGWQPRHDLTTILESAWRATYGTRST